MKQSMELLTSHKTDDWFTPPDVLELVYKQFGQVPNLDPAANVAAPIVALSYYYESGANLPWFGYTFVNPPHSGSVTWAKKAVKEIERNRGQLELLYLTKACVGYEWFNLLMCNMTAACFFADRIAFVNSQGLAGVPARFGSVMFYSGQELHRFEKVFSQVGYVFRLADLTICRKQV